MLPPLLAWKSHRGCPGTSNTAREIHDLIRKIEVGRCGWRESVSVGQLSGSSPNRNSFGAISPITILPQSALNSHGETDDESTAYAYISKFVDANGSHNVETAGVFVEKCTSITGYLYVDECDASADAIARDAEAEVLAYGEDTLELFVGWKRGVASEAGGTRSIVIHVSLLLHSPVPARRQLLFIGSLVDANRLNASGRSPDDKRRSLHADFDFAKALRLFLFSRPKFVVEVDCRSRPHSS